MSVPPYEPHSPIVKGSYCYYFAPNDQALPFR